MRLTVLLPLVVLAACAPKQNVTSMGKFGGAPPSMIVTSDVRTAGGETLGIATFAQEPDGLWVSLETKGLPAGEYGVHLHAIGRCEGPDFTSAGPHYNPAGTQHGSANPAGPHGGDLPNLVVGDNGKGRMSALLPGVQLKGGTAPLLGPEGSAILIHAGKDDYRTDPSGNSGNRIACGILQGR